MRRSFRLNAYPIETDTGVSWVAEYPELKGCVGGGETIDEAIKEAEINKEVYLQELIAEGKPIPTCNNPRSEQYSGKFTVRVSKSMHKQLAFLADEEGISLNSLVNEAIAYRLGKKEQQINYSIDLNIKVTNSMKQDVIQLWSNTDAQTYLPVKTRAIPC